MVLAAFLLIAAVIVISIESQNQENDLLIYQTVLQYIYILLNQPGPIVTNILPYFPGLLDYLYKSNRSLNPLIYSALGLVGIGILFVFSDLFERSEEVSEQQIIFEVKHTSSTRRPKCLYCGSEILENANFCIFCGEARAICSVCNLDIIPGDPIVRCPHCGVLNHKDHLLEWIKVRGYCPNCREKLNLLKKV